MTKSKLILLEGIPGSGKSSAGAYLQHFIEDRGNLVSFWREGNFDHPADFEGVACLTEAQYRDCLSRYSGITALLNKQLVIQGDDHLLWYRKLQHLHPEGIPQSFVDELSHYDVYDGLPMADYCRLALQRWHSFQRSAQDTDEITILECCFLQNPLTVMLARHDAEPQVAQQHIVQVADIIKSLNPYVIYFSPRNARAPLEHVRAERPKEWADFVIGYLTRQEYGKAHGLQGYEGVIQFYEMRQKLELAFLQGLPLGSQVIEHSGDEWDRCHQEMIRFVEPFL
jgi:hypothetical protein